MVNLNYKTKTIPKILGGHTRNCLEIGRELYGSSIDEIISVSSTKVAEMTKLLENIHRAVNIGLINEMKIVADKMNIDIHEVINAASTKPFGFTPYYPGPGLGGHCIPIDPWFLVENTKSGELVRLARKINDVRPNIVAQQAVEQLQSVGGNKIGILGVAYKANVDDCRETPADAILAYLQSAGIEVRYHDPYVPTWDCSRVNSVEELDDWADTLILVTDHTCYANLNVQAPLLNTRA